MLTPPILSEAKKTGEVRFKHDEWPVCTLFDVNQLENTSKINACTGRVKVLVDVGNHFKTVGCLKHSLISKGCSNQLMSTSTKQGKKAGANSGPNPLVIL
jgi:hypothetical protein